ncbi:MAG TPA: rod shape-determining protein [Thermoanaerobaculia bacterium]|nr:rod shape-determining protein [Thermoanaerobaculia bacterium]HQN06399.1 rod shape-determining protein [Thermoanaerobaculia bacterium]HQP85666.1 rod shape-determining protein [Thermoanaerobaculia bacterium]
MSGKKDVLHVGIDLGTSRSAICASNGERHVVESWVGWPVDMVARKVVKKPVVFGHEALENRPMLDLHRPLERGLIKEGSPKAEAAVRELLAHLIEKAGGAGKTVQAVVGVPAEAMRVSRQHLRNAVKGVADALLLVSEPFAVAYGMDALLHTMIIDIGAGTSDFCVMNGRYPTDDDQRTLTHAGDTVDEQLGLQIRARHPDANFSIHMVREWKERNSFVGEPKEPVFVEAPVRGKPTRLEVTAEMRKACESLVGPLAETMLDLLSRVDPEYQQRVRNSVVLAGGGSQIPGLAAALERALEEVGGGRVRSVEDPVFAGASGSLAIAADAPEGDWERLAG